MNKSFDAIVVGAGIVGVSTALHLQMRGLNVALVDRRGVGQETSFGNSGILSANFALPYNFPDLTEIPRILADKSPYVRIHRNAYFPNKLWFLAYHRESSDAARKRNGLNFSPLTKPSVAEHRFLMQGTDAARHISTQGEVMIYRTEAAYNHSALERVVAKERGIPFEEFTPEQFAEIEPHVRPNFFRAVRWSTSARIDNPGAVVAAYGQRFIDEGGTFIKSEIGILEPPVGGIWTIPVPGGSITAKTMVICAGPWSAKMLEPLGYHFPMALKRGYHRHYALAEGKTLSHILVDSGSGVLAPTELGLRVTTGAEFALLDAPPTPVQLDRVVPLMREMFPLGEPVDEKPWMGSRPCFADFLPVIGDAPHPDHKGLYFNFGHGHLGLTAGPASGRLITEMILGVHFFCDTGPFKPERFPRALPRMFVT